TLEGRSQSSSRVSTYTRNLEGSAWMTKPDPAVIEAKDGVAGVPYMFSLAVQLANPNAPTAEGGDGSPRPVPAASAHPVPAPAPAAEAPAPAAPDTDSTTPATPAAPATEPAVAPAGGAAP